MRPGMPCGTPRRRPLAARPTLGYAKKLIVWVGANSGLDGGEAVDRRITVEICVGDVESAIAAEAGGADRVELCDNLSVGGTTPSVGTIAEACRWLSIPVHVLIRPRAGDFVYDERELAVMRRDIEAAKALGAEGIVLGVLDGRGDIARDPTAALIALARPLSVTFHKAVDRVRDPFEALDTLIALGVDRVLTSGGRPSAFDGIDALRSLVERSADRIAVMAGGRLAVDHVEDVIRASGVREIHLGSAACRSVAGDGSQSPHADDLPPWSRTDARLVMAIVELVRGPSPEPGE
jgi:copper homeostasis protein